MMVVSYVISDVQLNIYDLFLNHSTLLIMLHIRVYAIIYRFIAGISKLLYEYITETGSVSFTPYNVSFTDKKENQIFLIYKE